MAKSNLTDREIEELYQKGESRLSQERNDFLLPQILDFVRERKWINLRPEYQRRLVWDKKKRSKFIESLLMNVPIPPVFLYEWDLNRYEVMDGQQRLNSIVEYYGNNFSLSGLETWGVLNGKKYSDLPPIIQRGLDRRRISATVLLAESAKTDLDKKEIRRTVFERLNTGGQTLNAQELRNSLYTGLFNAMLINLAGNAQFDTIWGIPKYADHIRGDHISLDLANNSLFRRMTDCEIVLRFFAFRQRNLIKGSVRSILDNCMDDYKDITEAKIEELKTIFTTRLEIASKIFGEEVFRIKDDNKKKLSQPLYDAIMVAIDVLYDRKPELLKNASKIKAAISAKLKDQAFLELVIGKPNTADSIKKRLDDVEQIFKNAIK